jgi:hypothetical protein
VYKYMGPESTPSAPAHVPKRRRAPVGRRVEPEGGCYLGGCLVYIYISMVIMVIISMKYGYNINLLIVIDTLW